MVLRIQGYDVILGMDWLTKYQATIVCKHKTLDLVTLDDVSLTYKGSYPNHTVPLVSTTKAGRVIGKGCTGYLCAVETVETPGLEPKDISVVQEFSEVFQEVLDLPPDREIEFAIELISGIAQISKAPYRMALAELAELNKQLQ